mgnify:CR=1 FL=1
MSLLLPVRIALFYFMLAFTAFAWCLVSLVFAPFLAFRARYRFVVQNWCRCAVWLGKTLVGLRYEVRSVDLVAGDQQSDGHLDTNPQGLVPVLEIDRAARQVLTAHGATAYDKLVIATGSFPFVPPVEGAAGDSRLVYRTLEDLDAIRAAAKESVGFMRKIWDEREEKSLATVKAAGAQIVEIDKVAFKTAMKPVYDKFLKDPKLQDMVKRIDAVQ